MKKLTALLLAALLVFSLCACGSTPNQPAQPDTTAPPSGNVDQITDTTDSGTPLTAPTNGADVTTSSLAVSENEQEQEAAAAKLADYDVDIDTMGLNNNMVTAQMTAINQDPSSYLGKRIRVTGVYDQTYYEPTDKYYNYVLGYDETGCCAAWGIEFYGDAVPEKIEPYTSISMVGKISTYDEEGITYTFIDVEHFAMG
ncbi:MAG: hypothetical protein II621_05110 [Clostridia bacterium]|nr:hypothetical protein [Clostridia bacterium]